MRRTTRVFMMVRGSEAAVLRSGRRLWPDSGEVNPKCEVNEKPKILGNESRKSDGGTVDRMFGTVYTRKRMRNGVQKCQLSDNSDQRKRRKKFNNDVEEPTVFAFVVENGDCCRWFSNILFLVLDNLKRVEVGLSEVAAFLMSEPLSSVYASNGVHMLWGPSANGSGICKFFGAREFAPLFYVDFSAVPCCFMFMHYHMLLSSKRVQLVLVNTDEIISGSAEDEPCIASVVDVSKGLSGSSLVKTDILGSKVVSDLASKMIGQNSSSYRFIQRRRSSLRKRRARNPSLFGILKASGTLMSDLISSRRNGIPFSSVVSRNKLKCSVPSSSVNLTDVGSSISILMQNVDSSQCSASMLVIEPDKCYREKGAIVTLEHSASREWLLVVKKDGSTKYACKANKDISPSSCNRFTPSIIWTGDDNWKLEFANGQDWAIFKDLYKECVERNVPSSAVKTIPVPGVHEVPGYNNRAFLLFSRPDLYISLDGDEVSRALANRTANYDMDSEDEEWLKKFNNEYFPGNGHCEHLSEDCFELIVDAFEKEAYLRSLDDNSNEEAAAAHLCLDLASAEVAVAVHAYWLEKRKGRLTLLRVFKGPKSKKAPVIPKSSRCKRRLFKRQASSGRGKPLSMLQALAAEQIAMAKAEEAGASATRSVESAILKRQLAQLLMQNADMATYKAMMALRIAEAAQFTTSSYVAVDQFFD
ncbi:hypothetical protein like AT5G04670 [Hibiscus trionum]|uniref:Enhancer of polycomb-like protein n=1 Tax=Hibiscus trionum TaxID=183268 RepID=A0A9W7MWA0_HIBTR|nr:hypothetical protein like AT5G04670 [Hibiscus trionum]